MRKMSLFAAAASLLAFAAWAAPSPGEIVIAQAAPFSGPLAPTGTHIRAGIQLSIDRINAAGGVHGARLKLVSKDDAYKSEETVRLVKEMVREVKPVAFAGIVGTGNVEALIKEGALAEAGVALVGGRSGAMSLVKPVNPWIFQVRATYAEEVEKIVQQLSTIGFKQLAVFYQDDPFGKDGLAGAEASAKKAGIELVAKAGYEKNTTKVENAVKLIGAAQPQGVIMVSNTAASAEFLKQFRAAGHLAQLISVSVTDGPQVAKRVGNEVAHGFGIVQVVPDPNHRGVPISRELQDAYERFKPQGIELNHTLLEGFLIGKVVTEGLRRAGPNPTPKKLRDALESIRDFDAGGLYVTYSPGSHAGSRYTDITIVDRQGRVLR
jgi:ABC-type branched-subunit amino acid transport system substrate-binding protein